MTGSAGPSPARRGQRHRPQVGQEIKRWRKRYGFTLTQVAARSGLNVGYLSQLENDKASPSLETLSMLAEAIGVPMTWFLLESSPPPRILRASERRRWRGPGGLTIEDIDGGKARDLRIVMATARPGQSTGPHAHAGDEHHVVLSGRLRLTQGDYSAELGPGDYLGWDATISHDSECIGDEESTVLIISHQRGHGSETSRPDEIQRRSRARGRVAGDAS